MLTDKELDDLRLTAQNYVRELRQEFAEFRARGREYLQQPEIDFDELEELIQQYGNQNEREIPNSIPSAIPGIDEDVPANPDTGPVRGLS